MKMRQLAESDGRAAVVRIPASASLDVGRAMTLSGWVRPSAPQPSWRTLVQRQVAIQQLELAACTHRLTTAVIVSVKIVLYRYNF